MVTDTLKSRGSVAYHAGDAAEQSVARDYERRGIQIAHRRWRGRSGEIDLIARDGAAVVFIEVKKSRSFANAAARLSVRQMGRIYRTAEEFLGGEPSGLLTEARFDAALVDSTGAVQVIENAFGLG